MFDIKTLIKQGESEELEFKQTTGEWKEIIETVSAFSNTKGGLIVVGVNNNGIIQGIIIGKDTIEKLTNKISQNTDPKILPTIKVHNINNYKIIIIEVKESSDHLVLAFGRPYKRVGKSTVRMSKDEYEIIILEKHKNSLQFDNQICKNALLKDIDENKVTKFLIQAKAERNHDVDLNDSLMEILDKLFLLNNNKILNAAILLFAKNPIKFFPQAKIRAARFKDINDLDYIDMKVFQGTLIELKEKSMNFVMEHINHGVFFDSNKRHDKWEYPLRAIEEAINNSLTHRDYFSNADIQLSIYDDRIEIWNPGELSRPLTIPDLKRKHKSLPRNKLLADKLFLIKFIEQWGKGTNRIFEEMDKYNLPEPQFQNISGGFEITLYGPLKKNQKQQNDKEFKLHSRQKKALDYLKKHGSIKRSEYVELNNISHTIAHKELKELVLKEILKITGSGKYLKYMLTQG
jgi:ATP-dependent DNA helicase RecG